MTEWKSRIVGHGEEAPDQLLANPRNWRTHPKAQRKALVGLLDQVGWVQDIIVNRQTGHVVDGHLRVEEALSREAPVVPVVYVDLSPEEESLVLASLDPLGAMAGTDKEQLASLLADVTVDDEALAAMLGVGDAGVDSLPDEPPVTEKWLVVVECEGESEQALLLERFQEEGLQCKALIA